MRDKRWGEIAVGGSALRQLELLRETVDRFIDGAQCDVVDEMRAAGAEWSDIAPFLGLASAQGAGERIRRQRLRISRG